MKKNIDIFWCKSCLNTSTRPRISFNKNGICNACTWSIEKKNVNWKKRIIYLKKLIKKSKSKTGGYDCIIPVSGGKDGSYVAYQLKHKYNLNPLTVTVRPEMETDIGKKNLLSFVKSGFDHIHITPNQRVMKLLNKYGFIHKGFPYYGWLIAIHTAILRVAVNFNINLIFYGEDGEVEYGGSKLTQNIPVYDVEYQKKIYLEGGYNNVISKIKAKDSELYFFKFPKKLESKNIKITHWSYFEPWDSYKNYLTAKKYCGLTEKKGTNKGTFTNFAQNDQALYDLHTYMMYLKFGFGRATQDAGIEIRRGAMTRDQAINLVTLFDGKYPSTHLKDYLTYFDLTKKEFDNILSKWVNKKLFYKNNKDIWIPNFKIS